MIKSTRITLILFLVGITMHVQGQVVYVTDQIQVGLHADQSLQSPIVKVVASGTALELVKQENELSYVTEPGGTGGWVDNSYISEFSSADPRLQEAEQRIRNLEASLSNRQSGQTTAEIDNLMRQLEEQSSRVEGLMRENTSLQREITSNNPGSLYEKIDQLSIENRQLEEQLASILETTPISDQADNASPEGNFFTARNILIASAIVLGLGIGLGIYIMDFFNRRRHGGFRV